MLHITKVIMYTIRHYNGLYIYYPIFEGQKRLFLKGAFFVKFSPYVRLVGYDGARTVKFGHSEKAT